MLTPLRQIGNSKGVIIPSAYIEQLQINSEVELTLDGDVLLLKASTP
ncbi:MAG: hypothetical protein GX029_02820, partial [Pseudomonadaceae bacterium]|nr:hypothetical protein [Pseudomonadaceae bacterium]